MTQHTKGPWKIGSTYTGSVIVDAPQFELVASVYPTSQEEGWDGMSDFPERAEMVANCRLIAAAPDLLELAWQYRNDLIHPPAPDSRVRRLKAIAAVIAKATA